MSNVFTETLRQIAQQNANRSQAQYSESCAGVIRCKASGLGQTIEWAVESPREMTAEDLGLPLSQWSDEWLSSVYGYCPPPLWLAPRPESFTPYAFWLGAEAA